jgi:hypothetical protein
VSGPLRIKELCANRNPSRLSATQTTMVALLPPQGWRSKHPAAAALT